MAARTPWTSTFVLGTVTGLLVFVPLQAHCCDGAHHRYRYPFPSPYLPPCLVPWAVDRVGTPVLLLLLLVPPSDRVQVQVLGVAAVGCCTH